MSTENPDVEPTSDIDPPPAASPSDVDTAPPERTDIYFRIRRFAPLLVVLFCAGILLVMAVLRPFPDPGADPDLRDPLVGAGADPTGAYMIIDNNGGSDTLLDVSTPAAETVELQEREGKTDTDPGTLATVSELEIRGYEETRLQPGDDQIRLSGLVRPLNVGDSIELTLRFERAGAVTVQAQVETFDEIAQVLLGSRLRIPDQTTTSAPSSTP